jgi:DNA-binding FrmR family transcriptional regulator
MGIVKNYVAANAIAYRRVGKGKFLPLYPYPLRVYVMRSHTKKLADQRLARIEGQVKAVRRLVEEEQYCVDVVRQVQAARAALASMETLIVEDHVNTCVEQALTNGSIDERRDKVNELVGILSGKKK